MQQQTKLRIGLVGFGVVGEGIYQVLKKTPSLEAEIVKIGIKDPTKTRNAPLELFTTNVDSLLEDANINVIVELIDDAEAAYHLVKKALKLGKSVVSANKKMIAAHQQELIALQNESQTALLYEAAVGGSLPIIRNLEEYYDNDLLHAVAGIINGSTNYILSKLQATELSYEAALADAQSLGFAESDPSLDVSGNDSRNKLSIILNHAFGILTPPEQIVCYGINHLRKQDIIYAKEKNWKIRLVAHARLLRDKLVQAYVLPTFVRAADPLYSVDLENNGIAVGSSFSDQQFFSGKGAGRYPTASAVLSDISALRYDYKYEYRKFHSALGYQICKDNLVKVYLSYKNQDFVEKTDFDQIEERYESAELKFIIGWILLEKIRTSKWLKNPELSLILYQN